MVGTSELCGERRFVSQTAYNLFHFPPRCGIYPNSPEKYNATARFEARTSLVAFKPVFVRS